MPLHQNLECLGIAGSELRHDVIETSEQQHAWARHLAPILTEVLAETGL